MSFEAFRHAKEFFQNGNGNGQVPVNLHLGVTQSVNKAMSAVFITIGIILTIPSIVGKPMSCYPSTLQNAEDLCSHAWWYTDATRQHTTDGKFDETSQKFTYYKLAFLFFIFEGNFNSYS
jgi:hypothetical protein